MGAKLRRRFSPALTGLRSFREDLTRLALILSVIATICTPGIVAKLVGLLKIGIAGAAPAIHVGTLIVQTAPLTVALAAVRLLLPLYFAPKDELDDVDYWWRRWPFNPFLPYGFCALVLATTTYASNAVGLYTGVSLARVWDDAKQGGLLTGSTRALFSLGSQYLEAYGVSAFISAFVIAYFLARWYRRAADHLLRRGQPDMVAVDASGWTLLSFADGRLVWENMSQNVEPRHLERVGPEERDTMFRALVDGDLPFIETNPWRSGR
jgi:hypothetical protein